MSRLNEPLAKKSNFEDNVKGRFWESRLTSIALLDATSLLSCMAYVDLSPIRAGLVEDLQSSLFTSIQKRVNQLTINNANLNQPIEPVAFGINDRPTRFKLKDYIVIVEWAVKIFFIRIKLRCGVG